MKRWTVLEFSNTQRVARPDSVGCCNVDGCVLKILAVQGHSLNQSLNYCRAFIQVYVMRNRENIFFTYLSYIYSTEQTCGRTDQNGRNYAQHHIQR